MQVNKRLLFGSIAVSLVVSVAVGWAIAQNGHTSSTPANSPDTGRPRTSADIGSIDTNASVEGTPLPDVMVQTLDGKDVELSSLVGTPLVINVWSSTCIPCKDELPAFAKANEQYGSKVRFVGIDFLGAAEAEEKFARSKGITYRLLYDSNGEFISAAGLASFPVTLFVNADGKIVRQAGQLDLARLTHYIETELL
ncbi:MAG: TlpA disulfide reductase family protein [Actinomycetota bacterium]